jgi:HAD superfamily hydrolase (TIGR01509 family)
VLRAAAFDYRDTLAEFRWDDALWRRGIDALLAAAGADPALAEPAAAALRGRIVRPRGDLHELDYAAAVGDVLRALGADAGPEAVARGIEAEYRTWAPARCVHPDTPALLDGVRALGLAVAVAANTFDPPGLFRADLAAQGIAGRADAVVLSVELGVRTPHPGVYAAVAGALGVVPAEVVFVGDTVANDVDGPAAAGMRTCLAAWYRRDPAAAGRCVPICTEPLQVLVILEALVRSGSAGKI